MTKCHVAIVGGGISGMALAWYLKKQGLSIQVFEKSSRFGGKVLTESISHDEGNYIVEGGPDSFLTQKPWAQQLASELGLDNQLLGTNDQHRTVYVLNKGKLVPLPEGVLLIVPTQFIPFALSPLISPLGKLRMGLDFLIPPKTDDQDETLAQFIRRRLGQEALDKIAEPLMSGIYNAEAEKQSVLATFPRLKEIEKKYGSLIRGMLASKQQQLKAPKPKLSMFASFTGGTQTLIHALEKELKTHLRPNTQLTAIHPLQNSGYQLEFADQSCVEAEQVVFATPSFITSKFIQSLAPECSQLLNQIRYVSTGIAVLAYPKKAIQRLPQGFGFVVPTTERRPINAVTVASTKFAHRAPEGSVLLRVFFGGSRSPQTMNMSDEQALSLVKQQLNELIGASGQPYFEKVYRWEQANPQYDVGHLELVEKIEKTLPTNIHVLGSAYRGVGLPDCVHQAQLLTQKIAGITSEK